MLYAFRAGYSHHIQVDRQRDQSLQPVVLYLQPTFILEVSRLVRITDDGEDIGGTDSISCEAVDNSLHTLRDADFQLLPGFLADVTDYVALDIVFFSGTPGSQNTCHARTDRN